MTDKQTQTVEAIWKKHYPSLIGNYDIDTVYEVAITMRDFAPQDALKLLAIIEDTESAAEAPLASGLIHKAQGNDRMALECFLRAHDLGSDCGSCLVGRAFMEGLGTEQDESAGERYLAEAFLRCGAEFKDGMNFQEWLRNVRGCELYEEAILAMGYGGESEDDDES